MLINRILLLIRTRRKSLVLFQEQA